MSADIMQTMYRMHDLHGLARPFGFAGSPEGIKTAQLLRQGRELLDQCPPPITEPRFMMIDFLTVTFDTLVNCPLFPGVQFSVSFHRSSCLLFPGPLR
jgi:hypothetical protein